MGENNNNKKNIMIGRRKGTKKKYNKKRILKKRFGREKWNISLKLKVKWRFGGHLEENQSTIKKQNKPKQKARVRWAITTTKHQEKQ